MKNRKIIFCLFCCTLPWLQVGYGQSGLRQFIGRSHDKRDTNYIHSFDRDITGRLYYTRDNTGTTLRAPGVKSIDYKPNNSKGIGLGVSYRYLTLNLSFKLFGEDPDKGRTKSLSLQTSLYKEQWVYDFGYQHFKGMYLSPQSAYSLNNNYYLRPDVRSTLIGGDFWRILNSDRFSYRSVMTQNEWQLKSAGTLLLGGELYFGSLHGDSALVPMELAPEFPQSSVDKLHLFRIGAGVGYAYTYVFKKNFFVSGGLTALMDLASTKEFTGEKDDSKTELSPNLSYRLSVGYNSRQFNINASLLNNSVTAKGRLSPVSYNLFTQQFRVTIAHRFIPGQKTKKQILHRVDKQLDNAEEKANKLKKQYIPLSK